jgi:hypothetical protein
MHSRSSLLLLFALLVTTEAGASVTDTVRFANRRLSLGFDGNTGALVDMTDVATGQHLLRGPGGDLWRIELFEGGKVITPANARSFKATHYSGRRGVHLAWSDFGLAEAPSMRVVVSITMSDEQQPMSDWRIALDSTGTVKVEQVRFPRIEGIARQPDEELIAPRWMGALARNPQSVLTDTAGKPRRLQFDYPGAASLQLIALYARNGAGFYAATDDTLAFRKSFAVWSAADSSRGYELLQPLENPQIAHGHWSTGYDAVIGTFQGDWYDAAEHYRAWGTQQRWARESRLKRGVVPPWLLQTGMWVWNRGASPKVLPPARALQDALGLPVSVFWHWWHNGPYDTSFPDYLPPREGADAFTRAVADADAAGLHAMVYMNQRLWCTHMPSWGPRAAAAAVKERDGRIREEVYNIFDPKPCATMDVTQPYWRDTYAGIADTVLDDYGVHGIYMDQAVLSLICWDPTHGHPLGGGNYWIHGFNALAHQIRTNAKPGRPVLLAGEGAGEPWLPELDLMLTLQVSQERYSAPNSGWEPIPLFQAVYHAYGVTYGSYSSLVLPPYDDLWPKATTPADTLALFDLRFRRQFDLEQARSFVWGLQPTIANFRVSQLTDRPTETAYMMNLARLRARVPEFLLRGTFMRPPTLRVPDATLDLSRVSIYAARAGGPTMSQASYPGAIAGAWRAANGDIAIAVASILDEPVTVSFDFDPAAYGLAGTGSIAQLEDSQTRSFGRWTGPLPVKLELPAGGATILTFQQGLK